MQVPRWLEPILHFFVWLVRPKYLVGVFPVCIDDHNRVLLIKKRLGAATGWQLPGGGKEYGVSLEVQACRELHEETGLVAAESDLRFISMRCVERYRDVNVVYLVTRCSGTPKPVDVLEIEEARWVPFDEALRVLHPDHGTLFSEVLSVWYRTRLEFS